MSHQQPQLPGKLPIPRLERPRKEPSKKSLVPRQGRVSRACLSCRARKIKCNGAQPQCQNCVENSAPCVYVASRKDRLKTATEHNLDLLQLLQELRPGASPQEKQKIDIILAAATEDVAEAASAIQKSPDKSPEKQHDPDIEEEGEANVSAEVGSNEDVDNMDEDLLRTTNSRATGYMGKNSEVQWLRKLHHEADSTDSTSHGPYGPPGESTRAHDERIDAMHQRRHDNPLPQIDTSSCSFYLDDESLDIDAEVDPYELPPLELAERLLKCYMQTVQSSFPMLSQKTFTKQFYHYYSSVAHGTPYKLPQKWQAMLNMVFAIGAVYSHLTEADWATNDRDHLLYHDRAWALSLNDPWWLTHPDLAQMQITGLLSFFYMSIGHINRSWVVSGMSIRFGFSLGLHIRNEDRTASTVKKEILSRIWWAIYLLDRTLSVITGRPSVGADIYCSTTLPLPISANEIDEATIAAKYGTKPKWSSFVAASPSDASSSLSGSTVSAANPSPTSNVADPANTGSFLTASVKLGMVSNKVLTQIYSPNIVTKSWRDVQRTIAQLLQELDAWLYALPTGLDPFKNEAPNQGMQQERNILKVNYYSTKILICRPCLCRLDRRIQSQTQYSDNFNHQIAAQCLEAAKSISASLPDDMAVWSKEIYKIFPWWSAVHHLMQALAILLLEACYEGEGVSILPATKKLVRWLRELGFTNGVARRAYSITFDLLEKMCGRSFKDPQTAQALSDLLAEDPRTNSYDAGTFGSGAQYFTGEEFLEQFPPLQSDSQSQHVPFPAEPSANIFPSATDLPLQGFFHEALNSHSPLANVFLTGFDQHNPLPFMSDMFMEDVPPEG